MKLHQTTTEFNCGIDLHAGNMYICVMNREGKNGMISNGGRIFDPIPCS